MVRKFEIQYHSPLILISSKSLKMLILWNIPLNSEEKIILGIQIWFKKHTIKNIFLVKRKQINFILQSVIAVYDLGKDVASPIHPIIDINDMERNTKSTFIDYILGKLLNMPIKPSAIHRWRKVFFGGNSIRMATNNNKLISNAKLGIPVVSNSATRGKLGA